MDALGLILGVCGIGLFGWLLYEGFLTGTMRYDYIAMHLHGRREDQPVRFWLTALVIGLGLLMSVSWTAVVLIKPFV